MPRTWANSSGNLSRNANSAARVLAHQSSGFCSDQRGLGRETVKGDPAVPTTLPSLASNRTFTSDVPRSMPRYMDEPLVDERLMNEPCDTGEARVSVAEALM